MFALGLLWSIGNRLWSQDVHFTQFFTQPLIINPAQTGFYEGNYRIGFNAKMQWPWAIRGTVYNYHTESPYVDFSFLENKLKVGWMGIGFNFLNDEAGDGSLTYRRFGLSYAYHQALDKEHRYILSAGVGVNYIIRSVDFSKFYFNNQWNDDIGFVLSVPSNEPLQRETFGMVDVSAGINFSAHVLDQLQMDAGFSMLHINRPKHTFFNNTERLGFRYQANGEVKYFINEKVSVAANAYYTYEKKASEIIFGVMAGYGFKQRHFSGVPHVISFGMYYRVKDALAPVVGYEFKKTRLLLSYDITLSKLISASKANGGPEISLVHIGSWTREFNGRKTYCPKFR